MESRQRGRLSLLQVCFTKSRTSRAVVFGSSVTGFNSGGLGACTVAHSSTIVFVCANESPAMKKTRMHTTVRPPSKKTVHAAKHLLRNGCSIEPSVRRPVIGIIIFLLF